MRESYLKFENTAPSTIKSSFCELHVTSFSNFRYDSRIMSLRGYILPRNGERIEELRADLFTKINGKTNKKLIYFDGEKKFFCHCFADAPVVSGKIKESVEFNINFTVPDFYWYEFLKTEIPVCTRINHIETEFRLPTVFTTRIAEATINNPNNFNLYPIIKIIAGSTSESETLEVLNDTTGESVVLSGYTLNANEIVTIDCKTLDADASGVSVINYLNDFSDFSLIPGSNHLICTNARLGSMLTVAIEYYRPYIGI